MTIGFLIDPQDARVRRLIIIETFLGTLPGSVVFSFWSFLLPHLYLLVLPERILRNHFSSTRFFFLCAFIFIPKKTIEKGWSSTLF